MLEALGLIPSIAWVMETYAYHPTTGMFRFIFCYIEFKASLGYVKLLSSNKQQKLTRWGWHCFVCVCDNVCVLVP